MRKGVGFESMKLMWKASTQAVLILKLSRSAATRSLLFDFYHSINHNPFWIFYYYLMFVFTNIFKIMLENISLHYNPNA